MSFREKIHGFTFITIIIAFGVYFIAFPWDLARSPAGLWASIGLLIPITVAIIIAMTIASAWFAIRAPAETNLREDERDRAFHLRGTHYAYYPLVIGVWLNIFLHFVGIGPVIHLNLLLATVVVAELVRIGTQVMLYRRGF